MNINMIIYTNDNVVKKNSPACPYHPVYQMHTNQFPGGVYWKKFHKGNQQIIKVLIDNNHT